MDESGVKINNMLPINHCQKVVSGKATFYFGPSTKEKSVGYLELQPQSSLALHNREGGIETVTQVKGQCVMIIFDRPQGANHLLKTGDKLIIKPKGVRHIHTNPFDKTCLTYWHFDGDIRKVIEAIRKGAE